MKTLLAVAALCSLGLAGYVQATERDVFTCNPKTVTADHFLTITPGMPHAGELAIVNPKGEFFFIAQRDLAGSIPSNVFKGIATLQIHVGTFMAHRWRAGAPDYEVVFSEPGTYKLLLGDALESDAGTHQTCEIVFKK